MQNPTESTGQIDISEQSQQNSFLTDRDAPTNPVLRWFLTVLAWFIFYSFVLANNVRFVYRQASYFVQRRIKFGDHRTPQQVRQDVSGLAKVPNHVAFVLKATDPTNKSDSTASSDVSSKRSIEGASWCIGVGSHELTLYERTGMFKLVSLQSIADVSAAGLASYFSDSDAPLITVRRREEVVTAGSVATGESGMPVLKITSASEDDGRPVLVQLAKEYSTEIASGCLQQSDISVNKIDADVKRRVGDEPDLSVSFDSKIDVAGFSPWSSRVTELFSSPDNNGVFHYMVFYAASQKFANVKVNLGA